MSGLTPRPKILARSALIYAVATLQSAAASAPGGFVPARSIVQASNIFHFVKADGKLLPHRAKERGAMSKRILVVEDDFDTRYMLSLILKSEGYEVITAADGEGALAVVF